MDIWGCDVYFTVCAAVDSFVYGFAEVKSFYALSAASDEETAVAFGTVFYIFFVTVIYMLYVFGVTGLLCMKKTYIGNIWSKTAALLAYSGMGRELSVPSTVKVMESTTPLECSAQIMLLLVCYALTLSFLMLFFQMKIGKKAAAAAGLSYSLFGFLLDPEVLADLLHKDEYQMFLMRRITGWISPLNHATYGMHDFGYDVLPSIGQSCLVFLGMLLVLGMLSFLTLKKYNFSTFTGE